MAIEKHFAELQRMVISQGDPNPDRQLQAKDLLNYARRMTLLALEITRVDEPPIEKSATAIPLDYMEIMEDRSRWFAEDALILLKGAREEGVRLQHNYIGTEHLLLGAMSTPAAEMLVRPGEDPLTTEMVRSSVEFIIGRGDRVINGDVGFTPRAKIVILNAAKEAGLLGHSKINSEDILVGLLLENESIGVGVLEGLGVNIKQLLQDYKTTHPVLYS